MNTFPFVSAWLSKQFASGLLPLKSQMHIKTKTKPLRVLVIQRPEEVPLVAVQRTRLLVLPLHPETPKQLAISPNCKRFSITTGAHLKWLSSQKKIYEQAVVRGGRREEGHWILDSPLARSSLNGTVERDTVKGSLWRPAKNKKKRNKKKNEEKLLETFRSVCECWERGLEILKAINHWTKVGCWAIGKCRRAATVQEMLSVLQGRGIACMCAFGVSMFLFVLGGGLGGRVCCEGSGAVCLWLPGGTWISSCPYTLSWKDCIRSI